MQRAQAFKGLDGRGRGIHALQRTVVQRLIDIVAQVAIIFKGDTRDKGIGIVAWVTHKRQYVACFGVNSHNGTAAAI